MLDHDIREEEEDLLLCILYRDGCGLLEGIVVLCGRYDDLEGRCLC